MKVENGKININTLMHEGKKRTVVWEWRDSTPCFTLTSAQNRQLPLSQRPGKVTLENKLKPLAIVM